MKRTACESLLIAFACSLIAPGPVSAGELPSQGDAVLEYRPGFWGAIKFLEIDGQQLDPWHPENGRNRAKCKGVGCRALALPPGPHHIGFVTDGTIDLYASSVEFEAASGQRYRVDFEMDCFKKTERETTSLCFNCTAPRVLVQQGKEFVRHSAPLASACRSQTDRAGNVLLFEDSTLPSAQTASVEAPRKRLENSVPVFFSRISGETASTRVDYHPGPYESPERVRLLPGTYRFLVTLEGAAWQIASVVSGKQEYTLQAEPGRSYRLLATTRAGETQVAKNALGNTTISSRFSWEARFEDVTAPH